MIRVPGGKTQAEVPAVGSRVPRPEEIFLVPQPILKSLIKLGESLKGVQAKWAIGGDVGEMMKGVNVTADSIEIITTKAGAEEICRVMAAQQTVPPADREERLGRDADVEGKMLPVYVKSRYAELTVGGVRVKVYGDEQIKVGEWEWGDPLDFEPDHVYVVGVRVPLVPLRLRSDLDLGLEWLDRVELISEAAMRSHHGQRR